MNKYLKRTLVVSSVMIIIFSIIMLWPLPLRKVLRQETDTAMTVSLSDNDTNISSFSLSASSVEYRRIMEILEDYSYHCTWYSFIPHESFTGHGENLIIYTGNSGLVIDTASGRVFVDRGTAEHTYRMNYLGQNDSAKLTAQIKKVLKIGTSGMQTDKIERQDL